MWLISKSNQEQLSANGFILLNEVIELSILKDTKIKLNNIYNALEKNKKNKYADNVGVGEKLINNIFIKDKFFYYYINMPIILQHIDYLLKNGSYLNNEPYYLSQMAARDPELNFPKQQLHMDSRFPGPAFALSAVVIFMIDDFDEYVGCTRIVPKSHCIPNYPENNHTYPNEIHIKGKAGSVLIFNASLWHGGGLKLLNLERWSIICTYSRWFVRPIFDFTKMLTPNEALQIPSDIFKLLGFQFSSPHNEYDRIKGICDYEKLINDLSIE